MASHEFTLTTLTNLFLPHVCMYVYIYSPMVNPHTCVRMLACLFIRVRACVCAYVYGENGIGKSVHYKDVFTNQGCSL